MTLTRNRILILGEAYGREEADANEPFVGASGRLLRGMLRDLGFPGEWHDRPDLEAKRLWVPHDIFITNVVNVQPRPTNDISNLCGPRSEGIPGLPKIADRVDGYLHARYLPEIERVWREIQTVNPNIILSLGNTPTAILTRSPSKITQSRGTILTSEHVIRPDNSPIKILPTFHPAAVLRDMAMRPIVLRDLMKLKRHFQTPNFVRPSRLIWLEPNLEDMERFFREVMYPRLKEPWGVDIETKGETITEIGFARPDIGIVVPFYSRVQRDGNYWRNADEEKRAWSIVAYWLNRLEHPIFQNGLYDINYLLRMKIEVPHFGDDTMLRWHSVQPEMKKGLGFLASIFTDEPAWKTMRTDHTTLKKEDY